MSVFAVRTPESGAAKAASEFRMTTTTTKFHDRATIQRYDIRMSTVK